MSAPRSGGRPAADLRRREGFTLLEVLLAMVLVSIIAVSLFSILGTAFRARESARAAMDPVRAVHAALDLVAEDIEAALPPTGILAGAFIGTRAAEGSGLTDSLEFYRTAPLGPAMDAAGRMGGIERVEYVLGSLPGETLPALLRGTTRNLLSPMTIDPEVEVLCRRVVSFGMRYFNGTQWIENWDSTTLGDILPCAIQVALRVEWPGPRSTVPTYYEAVRTILPACRPDAATAAETIAGATSGTSGTSGTPATTGGGGA